MICVNYLGKIDAHFAHGRQGEGLEISSFGHPILRVFHPHNFVARVQGVVDGARVGGGGGGSSCGGGGRSGSSGGIFGDLW